MQQGAQRGGSRGIRVPPTGAPVEILEVHVRLRGRGVQQLQEVRQLLDEHRDRVLRLLRAVEELVDVQLLHQLRLLGLDEHRLRACRSTCDTEFTLAQK